MIVKSVLFFIILVTIIYVYLGQKSQNELIVKLNNEIKNIRLSIDLKIRKLINEVINKDTINNIKSQLSKDIDNIVKKQFEINKAKYNQNQISQRQREEIIMAVQNKTKEQINLEINKFKTNEFIPIKNKLEESNKKLEEKVNKTINQINETIYKVNTLVNLKSQVLDSIKLIKNMNTRIIANQESIKELSLMLESHVGVDPVNLIDFDVKEALSINVRGEEDNAGGPSYLIFDNQKMSKKDTIVTFTAKYDIKVYGIFVGMGGNGGRGYLRGQDHNHPVAYGGNGAGGQNGVRYTFNLKKGEKFTVQFLVGGVYSILKTPEKEIKIRQGSSSRGGSGGGHNSFGQPGKNSSGPDVSDIIKTHKKKDNTLIFSSLPKKFGGGGAGGHGGWWGNDRFGKSGYYGIGGSIRGRSNQMSAQRAIRNYGAGGGANSSISGNPSPGKLIYSGPGGLGGPSGLIMVVERISI